MPAGYWVMIWFSVACVLASPIGYRLLSTQRGVLTKGRWRLYSILCLVLFLLGLALLVALGLQYPVEPQIYGGGWGNDENRQVSLLALLK